MVRCHFTEELDQLGAAEDFLSLFGGAVVEQKRCDTVQLGGDLSVRAGKQFLDTGPHGASQTLSATNEEIDLFAAVADPVPVVTGAEATDPATGVSDTDQRADFLAARAGRRRPPKLPVAGSAYRPERQRAVPQCDNEYAVVYR